MRGIPHDVTDADEIARLDTLGVEQWVAGPYPMRWIVIIPDEITGRRISSSNPPDRGSGDQSSASCSVSAQSTSLTLATPTSFSPSVMGRCR